MRILLVGEYSRLHNSLKEGLEKSGHTVTLISTGDYFKDYPSDIKLNRKFETGLLKKMKVVFHRLCNIDLSSKFLKKDFFKHKSKLENFDIVQLINESPFGIAPEDELKLISFLINNNKKLYLLSCGTDYVSVNFYLKQEMKYSILTPYFEGKIEPKDANAFLKYTTKPFQKLHEFLYKHCNGVIASDLDYHIPLQYEKKYLGLIPNPINVDKLTCTPLDFSKIIIFHGINRSKYLSKGSDIFEKTLDIIKSKYNNKIEIIVTENRPYHEYVKLYQNAHILLDQIYAYDQGYNALEAMARGKVVFTGAEQEFLDHYGLQADEVCINTLPDVDYLVEKLSMLIENPEKIKEIGKNARTFIEREHHYIKIAERYLDMWLKA